MSVDGQHKWLYHRVYLSSVPWDLLWGILTAMVMQICHNVQPDNSNPVRHEVEVEHGYGAQSNSCSHKHANHALHEVVGRADLQNKGSLLISAFIYFSDNISQMKANIIERKSEIPFPLWTQCVATTEEHSLHNIATIAGIEYVVQEAIFF